MYFRKMVLFARNFVCVTAGEVFICAASVQRVFADRVFVVLPGLCSSVGKSNSKQNATDNLATEEARPSYR